MLTATQRGIAGEELFTACVTLTSNGDLELFRPTTDDDHTDVTIGKRGMVPALAIQVKTALGLDRKGLAVARMAFPEGRPREHPAFVYAIVYVVDAGVDVAWIVPSAAFNRLAYRGAGRRGKGIELQFMASPTRADRWTDFRCSRLDLGPRLLAFIGDLPASDPPRVAGAHLLLRRSP
ncbi:MAG TPA: hypothetical protein VJR46_10160, partial [Candidatus Dormibacteraeota bacterium]|nr:hypothetical protein [Candidatus Dormibacteraeota bacterium]